MLFKDSEPKPFTPKELREIGKKIAQGQLDDGASVEKAVQISQETMEFMETSTTIGPDGIIYIR